MVALKLAGPAPRAGSRCWPAAPTSAGSGQGRHRRSPVSAGVADRASARSANRTPRRVAEMVFQGGVVGLRRRHRRLEQHPAVDGQPPSVEGLHLVRNGDVGVQIRIPGPGVAVGERGRDQAA